jgi:hypothetical protein
MNISYAQQVENIILEWKVGQYEDGEIVKQYDFLEGHSIDGANQLPIFSKVVPLRIPSNLTNRVSLINFNGLTPTSRELDKLKLFAVDLNSEPRLEYSVSNSINERYLVVSLFPYYKEGGQIKKVSSFSYEIQTITNSNYTLQSRATVYPPNSVLQDGSGEWYKIRVNTSGVYKIDKELLLAMGIDVSSFNPQDLNVYGNATPMLPIANSIDRPNDLEKNSIFAFGESDGVFHDNDYFLFYAQGPTKWEYYNGYGFRHEVNLYSDYSYYYININSADAPKRIIDESEIVTPADFQVDKFNDYSYYEQELENNTKGGKHWYGEKFDYILNYDFLFGFPNLDLTDSVKVNLAFLALGGAGNSFFESRVDGTLEASLPVISNSSSYRRNYSEFYTNPTSNSINLNVALNRDNPVLKGWLDYVELNVRRDLVLASGLTQMPFRNYEIVGNGFAVGEYTVVNAFNALIWNITDPVNPTNVFVNHSGNNTIFKSLNDSLKEFVCLRGVPGLKPEFVESVDYQNLHALGYADYIIIYHPNFEEQAIRLGELHIETGKSVNVVNVFEIFEEFSCGVKDPTAIKSFLKMFYDRANGNPALVPDNVLLFGDGSYDPKDRLTNNTDFIPTYQKHTAGDNESSINDMAIDDYFVLLDDFESDAGIDMVDMGIGRLLARNVEEAIVCVDKIEHYLKNGSTLFSSGNTTCSGDDGSTTFGEWRNYITLIADNQHSNHFVNQQEDVYDSLSIKNPEFNFEKLYIDAFPLEVTTGGYRSPDLVQRLNERVKKGTLIANYCGHGGELGLAQERVVTIPQIESWDNINKLMLFVSATCEFTRFDDPSRYSAGEIMALSANGGSVTLYSTTRPVTFNTNDILNRNLMSFILTRDANGAPLTFGEIMKQTKILSVSGSSNYRSFMTVGDPALRLAIPEFKVVADSINGVAISSGLADSLRALKEVRISGHVENALGVKQTFYNGVVFPTIYDKEKTITTLGQTTDDIPASFQVRNNILYKGAATVSNGDFSFEFIVPKDINYNFGYGKLSFYADNDSIDNHGFDYDVIIGGIDTSATLDEVGPEIELYLNDENFANGGVTDQSPVLIASVFDSSGVNTVGNGIGHDITVILDGDTQNPIVANDFYTADLDTYRSGKVNYPISDLEEGNHTLTLKIWDVHNNSSESSIEFVVAKSQNLTLNHVLNYPNPFSTSTEFFFEHNQHCQYLETQIQIFSVSGKLVKTINQMVRTEGFRTEGIHWNGRDDFGDVIGKGVYIYRVSVVAPGGEKVEKFEKLVILN